MYSCKGKRPATFGRAAAMGVAAALALFGTASAAGESGTSSSACALLTKADIAKATGLTVGEGALGPAIPGTLGKCTWAGGAGTKVILTLSDARHMQMTIAAQENSGAKDVPGLGSKAVAVPGPGFTGGGYIVSVLDAKGGFGVSILGREGTRDRVIALARVVENHR